MWPGQTTPMNPPLPMPSASQPWPTELTLDQPARQLRIVFDDGREFVLSFEFLRVHSPSAEVRGHGPGQEVLQLDDADILTLHRIGSGGLLPDRTVLLQLDPGEAARRLAERDRGHSDRIGGRDTAYHARVAAAFRRFAEADPHRFALIDASGAPEDVHARVLAAALER